MKNDEWFPILQVTAIVLFVVLLAWAIVRNVNQEQEFTIYEEVCRNETYTNYFEQTDYSKEIKCYDSKENEIKDLICYDKGIASEDYTYESCEQVEVEKIKIERGIPAHLFWDCIEECDKIMYEINYFNNGGEDDWNRYTKCADGCYERTEIDTFTKQEIDIELLDENCECLIGTYLCGRNNGFVTTNDSKNCDFIRNLISCQKYKCGDKYIVEVER